MLDKSKAFKVNIDKYRDSKGKLHHLYTYFFYCSCGEEIKSQSSQLKKHSRKCRKCCQRKRPYEHVYNELSRTIKDINLTYEEFLEVISITECHYCGVDLLFEKYSRQSEGFNKRAYQLDRKDNLIGYKKENLVPCCWKCNRTKSSLYTYEEFMLLSPILREINIKNKK